jgi:type III pantothenate kinase
MLLTIDIGNSNVVLALYNHKHERIFDYRTETFKSTDETAYAHWMNDHILKHCLEFESFIISNVVPAIDEIFYRLLTTMSHKPGYRIHIGMFPNFKVLLKNPLELGADFIATSFGALAKYPCPIVIVDLGSATKISVLNQAGDFQGGLIMPGIKVAQDGLNQFIPHLPLIPLEFPKSIIGQDTTTAMQSGLMFSTLASIEGICSRIELELNASCTKIITGGLGNLMVQQLTSFKHEPFLLNEGLLEIHKQRTQDM